MSHILALRKEIRNIGSSRVPRIAINTVGLADEFVKPHTSMASATAGIRSSILLLGIRIRRDTHVDTNGVAYPLHLRYATAQCRLGAEDCQLSRWTKYHVYRVSNLESPPSLSDKLYGVEIRFTSCPKLSKSELMSKVETARPIHRL